ncbi:MAG: hypothetical protein MMC23_008405 [Stictis urceolatum]|nr:hypothetical protein [Stictis urceolata]
MDSQTQEPATLLSLPNELLIHILEHILPSSPKEDGECRTWTSLEGTNAPAVLGTNRHLYTLGLPILCKSNRFIFSIHGTSMEFNGTI